MIFLKGKRDIHRPVEISRYKGRPLVIALFLSIALYTARAQETPPLINYPPSLYKAHNQNWSIGHCSDHLMYAANSDGLLEFDGASFKLHAFPNRQIVRSLLCDDFAPENSRSVNLLKTEHRIYVGGFAEFGFWQKDTHGQLNYSSLSKSANLKNLKTGLLL